MKNVLSFFLLFCLMTSSYCQKITPGWLKDIVDEKIGEDAQIEDWGIVTDGKPYQIKNEKSSEADKVIIDMKYTGLSKHVWVKGSHDKNTFVSLFPINDDNKIGTGCTHTCKGTDCQSCKLTVNENDSCIGGCTCKAGTGKGKCDHTLSQSF